MYLLILTVENQFAGFYMMGSIGTNNLHVPSSQL